MPMVPTTFVPGVDEQPSQTPRQGGPFVAPAENGAPALAQRTGAALEQAGLGLMSQGQTLGQRVRETVDLAQTKAAETQFLQNALPVLSKYKTTEGLNASQQYGQAQQDIAKAVNDARSGLNTPRQQRIFDLAVNDHLTTITEQMGSHNNVQEVQYGKQQGADRADSMNVMARMAYLNGDMAGYRKYTDAADGETVGVAQLSGSAADSDVTKAMLRAKRGQLARGVVSGLLEKKAVNEADDYFSRVQGDIDMPTAEVLDSAIKTAHRQEDPRIDGERAIMAAKGVTGPGVLQPPIPMGTIATTQGSDGIDIHAPVGSKVMAPATGTVTNAGVDADRGRFVEIALPNGYTAKFSGLGAVNYEAGQKITAGQVLGLSGADDNGRAATHYAITGPDGKAIDPRLASSPVLDPKSFNSPEDEEKAIAWVNANVADPAERKQAEGYVRGIAGTNRQIENQEHASALKQATDWWFEHKSIADLPADIKMKLSPSDIDSFNQEAKAKNDVSLLANWIQHPEQQSVAAVKQAYAQGRLSDNGYLTALRSATAMSAGPDAVDPQKARQVTVDHGQLTDILAANQLPKLAQPKNDQDKLQRVQLETAIRNEIDVQQQKNNRALTWQEKGKIARDMVIDKVYTPGMLTTGNPMPVTLVAPARLKDATVWVGGQKVRLMDIPAPVAFAARHDLQQNGVAPTQANIAAWWLRKGRPAQ